MFRFPLELPPVQKPRESWLRITLGWMVLLIIVAAWALAIYSGPCECDTDLNCEQVCGGSVSEDMR